jgi:hypothetical protein
VRFLILKARTLITRRRSGTDTFAGTAHRGEPSAKATPGIRPCRSARVGPRLRSEPAWSLPFSKLSLLNQFGRDQEGISFGARDQFEAHLAAPYSNK